MPSPSSAPPPPSLGAAVLEYEFVRRFLLYFAVPSLSAATAYAGWHLLTLAAGAESPLSTPIPLLLAAVLALPLSTTLPVLLLLVPLLVGALYALWWITRFLPTILEPCYELRITRDPDVTVEALLLLPHTPSIGGAAAATPTPATARLYAGTRPFPPPASHAASPGSGLWELSASSPAPLRARLVLCVVYSDRLGNHLFQYAYARLRALHLDVAFASPRPLGQPFARVAQAVGRWAPPDMDAPPATKSPSSPIPFPLPRHELLLRERGGGGGGDDDGGSKHLPLPIPLPAPLRAALASPALASAQARFLAEPVCKYAMNTRLYAGVEPLVAAWLRPSVDDFVGDDVGAMDPASPSSSDAGGGGDDLSIHVRLGDILWGAHAAYRPLPMSFYRAAVDRVLEASGGRPLRAVTLVTEDAAHPIILRMRGALDAHLRSKGTQPVAAAPVVSARSASPASDLAFLASAPHPRRPCHLILSTSSFAWWAAALNRPARLHSGGAAIVVVPGCGMMTAHSWQPAPRAHPSVVIRHDLTVPDLFCCCDHHSAAAAADEHGDDGMHPDLRRTAEAWGGGADLRGGAPLPATRVAAVAAEVARRWGGAGGGGGGDGGDGLPPPRERPGVVTIDLGHLPRWAGNTKTAIEELFD
jgi:hypothetical protein